MVHAGFVAVHLGAGVHSRKLEGLYKTLCFSSCEKGAQLLLQGKSALEAACAVLCILEDAPLTNAGFGSNLNEIGEVECDAGVMVSYVDTSQTQFGAVAAVKGVKNPINLAKEIILYQNEPRLLGRIPPLLLVGEGAHRFAKERGVCLIDNNTLISDRSLSKYKKYKDRLVEESKKIVDNKLQITVNPTQSQDTVGVICIDKYGNIASASSSGGILLKLPGRVGQVAMYGCGCWAQHSGQKGVAVTTSGCGEQLIQTTLAKTIGQAVLDQGNPALQLKDLMSDGFALSNALENDGCQKMGGVLVAHYDQKSVDFNMAFTTDSMIVGFMTTTERKPKVRVSRNSNASSVANHRLTMEGCIVKL